MKIVSLLHDLLEEKAGVPSLPEELPDISTIVSSVEFADLWEDAKMVEVLQYMRAGTGLSIPSHLRHLLPTSL